MLSNRNTVKLEINKNKIYRKYLNHLKTLINPKINEKITGKLEYI